MKVKYNLPKFDFESLRRIVNHFGYHLLPYKMNLVLSLFALFGVSLMTLLRPWPLKIIIDYVLIPGQSSSKISFLAPLSQMEPLVVIFIAAGAILVFAVLNSFFEYSQNVMAKTAGHGVTAAIRLQLFSHIQRLPQKYHDYRQTGELMTRLTGDINLLQDLLVETFIRLIGQIAIIVGMLVIAFLLDWQLALLIIAVTPFFLVAAFKFSGKIKTAANRQREKYGKLVSSIEETLNGISQVKVFTQEKRRDKAISKSINRDFKAGLKTTKLAANYARIVELITALGTALVLLLGAYKALDGSISPGDLIIFVAYLRGIYRPVRSIARLSTRIAKATVRGEKIMEILEIPPEVKDREDAVSARKIQGDIRFENVNFAYIDDKLALNDFNCIILPKKTTVIIGPTGAGKSTITKLLLRLYEHHDGTIYVDNREIIEYNIRSLRKRITSLTQDTYLFRATVRENIAFGNHRAKPEEIEKAARFVGADEFIRKLPEGYDTLIGEGGSTLSGGQRQRISFARAALRNSPIMIFDEPATGLDIHAEKEAKEALRILKEDHTLIIITHRLNFLELGDWAIYIRNGHLVEQGDPKEMYEHKGEFYNFVAGEVDKTGFKEWPGNILPSKIQ